VRVFRLITESQIEQSILDKAHHKLDIDQKIIQAGMFNRSSSEEDRRERLKNIMGCSSKSSWEGGPTSPEQLNRMMARTTEEFAYFQQIDANLLLQSAKKNQQHQQNKPPNSSFLVDSGRLVTHREVPAWITAIQIETGEGPDAALLTRDMRRKDNSAMINVDNLSDHQWLKLMEAQEAGLEYTLPKKRRRATDEDDDPL
jgi:hypothetical protein